MGENSKIEWTDHTFNPWRGCTKVSPGCANCYAETLSKRNPWLLGEWGNGKRRVQASEAMWGEPLRWARAAREAGDGRRPKVFCASLGDWLDEEVHLEWLARLLSTIHATPELDWLLLTKRPQNWGVRVLAACLHMAGYQDGQMDRTPTAPEMPGGQMVWDWVKEGRPPHNVWVGTSVEDQPRADERIPLLLKIPARVRFLSCEPLLGALDLEAFLVRNAKLRRCPECLYFTNRLTEEVCPNDGRMLGEDLAIDWVICGGESGPGARPMHPDWARGLRDQCVEAKVPFFFKQWGEWAPCDLGNCEAKEHRFLGLDGVDQTAWTIDRHTEATAHLVKVGKKAAGRLLDGRTWDEVPVLTGDAVPGATVKDGKGGEG